MKIYLVSTDGYSESIISGKCAKDAAGVEAIVVEYVKDLFFDEVRNVRVDLVGLKVYFECSWPEDNDWEERCYELISYDLVEVEDV